MSIHRQIAKSVQRRCRRQKVYVHNMLIRAVVGVVLDVLVEMIPRASAAVLQQHRNTRDERARRCWSVLRDAYTREQMEQMLAPEPEPEPPPEPELMLNVKAARRVLKELRLVVDMEERAALMLMLEAAEARGDEAATRLLRRINSVIE